MLKSWIVTWLIDETVYSCRVPAITRTGAIAVVIGTVRVHRVMDGKNPDVDIKIITVDDVGYENIEV